MTTHVTTRVTSRRFITVVIALFLRSQAGRQQHLLLVVVVTQLGRRLDGETTHNKAATAIPTPGRPLVESGGRRLVGRVAVGRQGGCARRANGGRLSPRLPCGVQQLYGCLMGGTAVNMA